MLLDWQKEDAKRLKKLFDERSKLSQAAFGMEYEIGTQGMVSQYLLGRRPLNLHAASKFASGLGVGIAEFSERLAKEAREVASIATDNNVIPPPTKPNSVLITQFDAAGAMGNGIELPDQPGAIENWNVSKSWLEQNVRSYTSAKNLCIVTGFGDSMQPMFNPGDPMLVDRGVKTVEFDAVYFFRIESQGYIKRLQRIPTEKGLILRAVSENKQSYEPFDITAGMDFEVLGRVLKVWRSVDF